MVAKKKAAKKASSKKAKSSKKIRLTNGIIQQVMEMKKQDEKESRRKKCEAFNEDTISEIVSQLEDMAENFKDAVSGVRNLLDESDSLKANSLIDGYMGQEALAVADAIDEIKRNGDIMASVIEDRVSDFENKIMDFVNQFSK